MNFVFGPWDCDEADLPEWRLSPSDVTRIMSHLRPKARVVQHSSGDTFEVHVPLDPGVPSHRKGLGSFPHEWLELSASQNYPIVSADGTDEFLIDFFLALRDEVPEGYEWRVSGQWPGNIMVDLDTSTTRARVQWVLNGDSTAPLPPAADELGLS